MKKYAFTLAEIMVVLTVIGIITAVLLPVAFQTTPNENVMKFKKGDKTLKTVINKLVTSDEYYEDGDLGLIKNVNSYTDTQLRQYLCQAFADQLSTKSVNCIGTDTSGESSRLLSNESPDSVATGVVPCIRSVTEETISLTKENFDLRCKQGAKYVGSEIVTTDGITYFNARPFVTFHTKDNYGIRYFSPPNQHPANYADENGYDIAYKIFCMDIDGIPDNVTEDDCINECPFGYGIRADGKILPGARADEWMAKAITSKDE